MSATPNTKEHECPLCGCLSSVLWKRAKAKDVLHAYQKSLAVDVSDDIEGVEEFQLFRCGKCDLGYFAPLVSGGNSFYEQLQGHDFYYPGEKSEFDFASRYVAASADVLEIGCGAGWFSNRIESKSYIGLEFTDKAVEMARNRGLSVDRRSIEDYARDNPSSADVVCAFQVLEHVPTPTTFLNAAVRALRPGGRLILSVPSADSFVSEAVNNVLNMPPHHVTWWTDKALEGLADLLALEVEAVEHEILADEHLEFYLYTLCTRGMNRRTTREELINFSKAFGLFHRLVSIIMPLLVRGIRDPKLRPRGHSVTFVYRKL